MNIFKKITAAKSFEVSIVTLIIINAIAMAIETSQTVMDAYGQYFIILNWLIQAIFVVEIGIRILSYAPRYRDFFKNGWNIYDFTIVALSTLPLGGAFVNVARLARVLRITRIISYSSDLKLIVSAMLRSIPSMLHVIILLILLLYVYAIIGFHYFSKIDPENWGTLGAAFLTLFQVITLENWPDIQEAVIEANSFVWLYFLSFIIVAVFVVMNLFIAVVINNLQVVKSEGLINAAIEHNPQEIQGLIEEVRKKLDEIEALVDLQQSN